MTKQAALQRRCIFLAIFAFLLGAACSAALGQAGQTATAVDGLDAADLRLIDSLFASFEGDRPGAAVMIAKSDELLFSKGYGTANRESGTKVTASTRFRIGSVSKQFTAMAILKLVEREELSLTDRLTGIFPDFPTYGQKITVHHLLTHQSGLPDYGPLAARAGDRQLLDADILKFLESTKSPEFQPGTQFSYSNSAYAVLAEIVRKTSGVPFAEFMRHNLFAPAGMASTQLVAPDINAENRAVGYMVATDETRVRDQSTSSAIQGDGSVYTSVNDYFQWHRALNKYTIVGEATYRTAYQPQPGTHDQYGFGWFIGDDRRIVQHGGATAGFSSYVARMPKDEITVAIFANRDPSSSELVNLAIRCQVLLSLASDGAIPMPPALNPRK